MRAKNAARRRRSSRTYREHMCLQWLFCIPTFNLESNSQCALQTSERLRLSQSNLRWWKFLCFGIGIRTIFETFVGAICWTRWVPTSWHRPGLKHRNPNHSLRALKDLDEYLRPLGGPILRLFKRGRVTDDLRFEARFWFD